MTDTVPNRTKRRDDALVVLERGDGEGICPGIKRRSGGGNGLLIGCLKVGDIIFYASQKSGPPPHKIERFFLINTFQG